MIYEFYTSLTLKSMGVCIALPHFYHTIYFDWPPTYNIVPAPLVTTIRYNIHSYIYIYIYIYIYLYIHVYIYMYIYTPNNNGNTIRSSLHLRLTALLSLLLCDMISSLNTSPP